MKLYKFFEKIRIKLSKLLFVIVFVIIIFSQPLLENKTTIILLNSLGYIVLTFSVLGRLWASAYLHGYKNKKLITTGPYSITRNPLYFFSFLGSLAIILVLKSGIIMAFFLITFLFIYPATIRAEERKLEKIFGKAYKDYKQEVPRFIPKFSLYSEPVFYTMKIKSYKKAFYDAFWWFLFFGFFQILPLLQDITSIPILFYLP